MGNSFSPVAKIAPECINSCSPWKTSGHTYNSNVNALTHLWHGYVVLLLFISWHWVYVFSFVYALFAIFPSGYSSANLGLLLILDLSQAWLRGSQWLDTRKGLLPITASARLFPVEQ